jgi:hypothetical protein
MPSLNNPTHIMQSAVQLRDRIALIHDQDGRLSIDRAIYQNEEFKLTLAALLRDLYDLRSSKLHEQAAALLVSTRNYIKVVDAIFSDSRPRFLTSMRAAGGRTFLRAYKDAVSLEKILDASLSDDELVPTNVPDQKPSPIYAKIEGSKIVMDSGRTLQPLLSVHSLERTRLYLKGELLQLIESLQASNVDRRLIVEIFKLGELLKFEDDAGAIVLGLHTKKVIQMALQIEHEISAVLGVQVSSTLTQLSHFAAQYKDWIEFLRNAAQYPAKQAVEGSIDGAVERFVEVLAANPDNVDRRIPATVKLIEGSLSEDSEIRSGAIYAAVRGFENVCIVAVKFAFDQVIALLKETTEKVRNYSAKILAVTIVTLAIGMITSFMPVIKAAPELNWVLENLPKIEKIRELIK